MRFRIRKNEDGSVYTIVVSGEMDDESGWDLLQVAQVMLAMCPAAGNWWWTCRQRSSTRR